jgi:ANTAR domain
MTATNTCTCTGAIERPVDGHDLFRTEQELAEFVAHRTVIDQAKGMLMFIYDIDAHKAFDLLKWRSQTSNVKLRLIAQQLVDDLPKLSAMASPDTRSACDRVLLSAHERVTSVEPPTGSAHRSSPCDVSPYAAGVDP